MDAEERRVALARRRHRGLLVGGILAFAFGGWPGLFAALMFVALVRGLDVFRTMRAS